MDKLDNRICDVHNDNLCFVICVIISYIIGFTFVCSQIYSYKKIMRVEPIISVIVPVYRAEAYIRRCLDSLVAQTFDNFEVILVDDGSPDKCGENL